MGERVARKRQAGASAVGEEMRGQGVLGSATSSVASASACCSASTIAASRRESIASSSRR